MDTAYLLKEVGDLAYKLKDVYYYNLLDKCSF